MFKRIYNWLSDLVARSYMLTNTLIANIAFLINFTNSAGIGTPVSAMLIEDNTYNYTTDSRTSYWQRFIQ